MRVLLTGKEDNTPPNLLGDSIRQSVFLTGFKLNDVKIPNRSLAGIST
jgi:N-acetylglucosaminyl-diphospho-decaprenol L-rhamnosyltransferase